VTKRCAVFTVPCGGEPSSEFFSIKRSVPKNSTFTSRRQDIGLSKFLFKTRWWPIDKEIDRGIDVSSRCTSTGPTPCLDHFASSDSPIIAQQHLREILLIEATLWGSLFIHCLNKVVASEADDAQLVFPSQQKASSRGGLLLSVVTKCTSVHHSSLEAKLPRLGLTS